jgi:hypothetical protein
MSLEIRAAVHFLWLKDLPNAEISREIDSVYGKEVIGLIAIQKWTHRFKDGITASKTGRGLIVLEQLNIWARFARYWRIIRIFCKKDRFYSEHSLGNSQVYFA